MFIIRNLFRASFLVVIFKMLSVSSTAAPIVWGPATNISGDSDVNTSGALVGAFNVGPSDVPGASVNGVSFQSFPVIYPNSNATSGNFALVASGSVTASFLSESDFGSTLPPFSNLSAAYQALLSSGAGTPGGNIFTLTISGLNIGASYLFQWWDNASNLGGGINTVATAGGQIILGRDVRPDAGPGGPGGVGQFAVGTFVADSTAETITFNCQQGPLGEPQINAFQVRAIPEPSMWGLVGVALPFVTLLRRRTSP